MGTTWQSLIWKEWHEHKWKLASITAVLVGATTLSLFVEDFDRFGLAFGMMFMCVIPLAVFVGLGAAANERSRGSLAFLQAQPISLWQVGVIKLILSLLTVAVPVVLTALSISAWRWVFDFWGVEYSRRAIEDYPGGIHTGNFFVDIAIYSVLLAMNLVIWTAAVGVNRKDEVSAGAIALSVILGWIVVLGSFFWLLDEAGVHLDGWGLLAAFSLTPMGISAIFATPLTGPQMVFGFCLVTIVLSLLAAFYVRHFGQTAERPIVSPKVATRATRQLDWLDSPRQSPLSAVVWKQFRESIPIALAGLAVIVAMAVVMYATDRTSNPRIGFAEMYFRVSISLGFCIALVAGIGVALQDMGPRLNTFWRSRPINASLWFWTKYATGLLIVLAAVYGPQLLLLVTGGDFVGRGHPAHGVEVVLLHVATYAAAVAMTCLVRHAVYAAVLSMGVLTACTFSAWLIWMTPTWVGWRESAGEETAGLAASFALLAGLFGCFLISTVIGWLAMRNDWGWKSRY
jgi:hypothetical protein